MDLVERSTETENADSVVQVLSGGMKPRARITFLAAHKALHLGIRTQPTGSPEIHSNRRSVRLIDA